MPFPGNQQYQVAMTTNHSQSWQSTIPGNNEETSFPVMVTNNTR